MTHTQDENKGMTCHKCICQTSPTLIIQEFKVVKETLLVLDQSIKMTVEHVGTSCRSYACTLFAHNFK